jgi:hypothetical protein
LEVDAVLLKDYNSGICLSSVTIVMTNSLFLGDMAVSYHEISLHTLTGPRFVVKYRPICPELQRRNDPSTTRYWDDRFQFYEDRESLSAALFFCLFPGQLRPGDGWEQGHTDPKGVRMSAETKSKVMGYLPDDTPPLGAMVNAIFLIFKAPEVRGA